METGKQIHKFAPHRCNAFPKTPGNYQAVLAWLSNLLSLVGAPWGEQEALLWCHMWMAGRPR